MKQTSFLGRIGWTLLILRCILSLGPVTACAHSQSNAYLTLVANRSGVTGEWHLALRDLEDAIGLDANNDGAITWSELQAQKEALFAYAQAHLHLRSGNELSPLNIDGLMVDNHSDGAYAVLQFKVLNAKSPENLTLDYRAFFDLDSKHRGFLRLQKGGFTQLAVFTPESPTLTVDCSEPVSSNALFSFLKEGVWHIWAGYDHILFLLALLLPGVLRREGGAWHPVSAAKPAFINVLKVVTAFTVAHSVTLSLAAMGLVHLPTRLVESAIAASVVLAAVNNLVPFFAERGWMVAFGFGLLHGFGFANALRDLGLQNGQLATTLFGFNVGVEIGQLAIVAVFFPLALCSRRLVFYQRCVLRLGSVGIVLIATTWLAERALNFKWLAF